MRLGSFRYLVKQGWKGMAANRLMTFASIGVLTVCLIITGIAALLSLNVNRIVDYFGDQNEITVFVLPEATPEQIGVLGEEIRAMPEVLEVVYVSKEDAYQEMLGMMDSYGNLLEGYEGIFPASFRVTVDDLSLTQDMAIRLSALPGVEYASGRPDLADAMITIKNAANYGGWALVAVLGLVAIIVISNTIRLTVFARRREISIMKYVGATNAFIRMPFFVEGMTVGLIAGLLAAGLVCGAYHLAYEYLTGSVSIWDRGMMQQLLPLEQVWYWVVGGFAAFGVVIGGMGTATSIRKHLKV